MFLSPSSHLLSWNWQEVIYLQDPYFTSTLPTNLVELGREVETDNTLLQNLHTQCDCLSLIPLRSQAKNHKAYVRNFNIPFLG